jgi:hypothetical protein
MEAWKKALNPDPELTRVQPLPVDEIDETQDPTFGGLLPALSDRDIEAVRRWLDLDIEYERAVEVHKKEMDAKVAIWRQAPVMQPAWWEIDPVLGRRPGSENHKLNIIWPVDRVKKKEEDRRKGKKNAPRL